jgi:hypothetical protein
MQHLFMRATKQHLFLYGLSLCNQPNRPSCMTSAWLQPAWLLDTNQAPKKHEPNRPLHTEKIRSGVDNSTIHMFLQSETEAFAGPSFGLGRTLGHGIPKLPVRSWPFPSAVLWCGDQSACNAMLNQQSCVLKARAPSTQLQHWIQSSTPSAPFDRTTESASLNLDRPIFYLMK